MGSDYGCMYLYSWYLKQAYCTIWIHIQCKRVVWVVLGPIANIDILSRPTVNLEDHDDVSTARKSSSFATSYLYQALGDRPFTSTAQGARLSDPLWHGLKSNPLYAYHHQYVF